MFLIVLDIYLWLLIVIIMFIIIHSLVGYNINEFGKVSMKLFGNNTNGIPLIQELVKEDYHLYKLTF